jgi:hypothetical protein
VLHAPSVISSLLWSPHNIWCEGLRIMKLRQFLDSPPPPQYNN